MRSKKPAVLIADGHLPKPEDKVFAEEEVRDPYLLEFLNLKDEYSETDLEEALIRHLESFLLELGTGFTLPGRNAFASATPGIESICSSTTEHFAAWWSST